MKPGWAKSWGNIFDLGSGLNKPCFKTGNQRLGAHRGIFVIKGFCGAQYRLPSIGPLLYLEHMFVGDVEDGADGFED